MSHGAPRKQKSGQGSCKEGLRYRTFSRNSLGFVHRSHPWARHCILKYQKCLSPDRKSLKRKTFVRSAEERMDLFMAYRMESSGTGAGTCRFRFSMAAGHRSIFSRTRSLALVENSTSFHLTSSWLWNSALGIKRSRRYASCWTNTDSWRFSFESVTAVQSRKIDYWSRLGV